MFITEIINRVGPLLKHLLALVAKIVWISNDIITKDNFKTIIFFETRGSMSLMLGIFRKTTHSQYHIVLWYSCTIYLLVYNNPMQTNIVKSISTPQFSVTFCL